MGGGEARRKEETGCVGDAGMLGEPRWLRDGGEEEVRVKCGDSGEGRDKG